MLQAILPCDLVVEELQVEADIKEVTLMVVEVMVAAAVIVEIQ